MHQSNKIKKESNMGMFSFIKEAGEKLFGIGEAKATEEVAKKDPTPVNVDAANKAAANAIANYVVLALSLCKAWRQIKQLKRKFCCVVATLRG
jgi:hypothetical protein